MPQLLTRRSVMRGAAVAATVVPVAGFFPGAAESPRGSSTVELVRNFARNLLTRDANLTAGEWIERKRTALGLLALIGDQFERWEQWELELMADMECRREAWS